MTEPYDPQQQWTPPPAYGAPTQPPGRSQPAGRKWLLPIVVGVVCLAVGAGIGAATGGSTKTKTKTVAGPTVTVTDTETETVEVTPTPSFDTPNDLPAPADFQISIKITDKQCFGSAGCDIEYQIAPKYIGAQDISSLSLSVTYSVYGVEDAPQIHTFTIDNGQASFDSSDQAQTKSSSVRITAKATSVDTQ